MSTLATRVQYFQLTSRIIHRCNDDAISQPYTLQTREAVQLIEKMCVAETKGQGGHSRSAVATHNNRPIAVGWCAVVINFASTNSAHAAIYGKRLHILASQNRFSSSFLIGDTMKPFSQLERRKSVSSLVPVSRLLMTRKQPSS